MYIHTFHSSSPSHFNHIANNTISWNRHGILVTSKYNTFVGNDISNNIDHGIYLLNCEGNIMSGNSMMNDGIFIVGNDVENWNTHTIDSLNTVSNRPVYYYKDQDLGTVPSGAGQVILANSDYWIIENQNCSFGSAGILLGYSQYNTIANSTFMNNIYGIYFYKGDDNIISNCSASSNRDYGLFIYLSDENRIDNSTINSNDNGIYLAYTDDNVVENCTIMQSNDVGIYLEFSEDVILHNNTMEECSIFIDGYSLGSFYSHTIDESNTVNGRPVYYWKNRVGGVIPQGAGQVILANCMDVVIENQDIVSATCGIEIVWSSGIVVTNCTASYNSLHGIFMFFADDNILANNTISNCNAGISIEDSMRNTLYNNTIFECSYGVQIYYDYASSENNLLFHNNFIDNTLQGLDYSANKNQWNAPYPIGGNYWSDYNGTDEYNGSNQNNPGSDGFGDTPYDFYWIRLDYYPLMNPTRDALPPRIELVSPGNNSVIQQGLVLDFAVYDESSYSTNYSIDNGPEEPFEPPYDISTAGWSEGQHTILIQAEDIKGNTASLLFSFTIDSISPIIQLNSPLNNSVIIGGTILNFSVYDSNLQNVNYSIDGGAEIPVLNPFDITTTGWTDGDYTVQISTADLAGNSNSSWYIFTVDSSPPTITLNSPINNSIIIKGTILNFSITDPHPVQANYSINEGLNKSLTEPYEISTVDWADGDHIVQINAVDSAGNSKSLWFIFTIDFTPPAIVLNSPGNNSVVTGGTILNGGAEIPLLAQFDISTVGWVDGGYTIQINARDLAGNSNSSLFYITIDSTPPVIQLNSPANNSLIQGGTVLDFSVFDLNPSQAFYSVNNGPDLSLHVPFNISTIGLEDGGYRVQINAVDMAGNSNDSWFYFTIDCTPPRIWVDPNLNHSTIPVGTTILLNISDLEGGIASYYIDGGIYLDLPSPYVIDTTGWSDGLHAITLKARDPVGNEASIWFEITVDAVPPYVVDTTPINHSIDFDIDTPIVITFSETMYEADIGDHLTLSPHVQFTPVWSQNGTVLSLSFAHNNLAYGMVYTLTIDPSITDIHGNPMSEDFILIFTTIYLDTDDDGIPDIDDADDDNDGYLDESDAFPLNGTEWLDTDGDGIGNNADPDDDADGYLDGDDAEPLNPSIWRKAEKPSDMTWLWFIVMAIIVGCIVILLLFIRKRGFASEENLESTGEEVDLEYIGEESEEPPEDDVDFEDIEEETLEEPDDEVIFEEIAD
jgi:parallel beta-helix repeat protein